MSKKKYLHLLILCGILSQGIFATSGKDTRESSDLLERKKRVINHLPGGTNPVQIENAKYLVNVKENNRSHCVGAILSHYTIITAVSCFDENKDLSNYKILSGGAYDIRSNSHNITSKSVYYGNLPRQIIDGIALATIDPPFQFGRTTGFIPLHEGYLPSGTRVTVTGWGHCYPLRPGPQGLQRRLRSITLPIISREECQNDYRIFYRITEKHICTHDEQQYCARTDIGAPLVYNARLVGIHVLKEDIPSGRNPEVYVDLNRPEYRAWIIENTILI